MDQDGPQQERPAYENTASEMRAKNPGAGLARKTEVQSQMDVLFNTASQLSKTVESLYTTFSSVLSPRDDGNAQKEATEPSPSTPLATNMRDLNRELQGTLRSLRMLQSSSEL